MSENMNPAAETDSTFEATPKKGHKKAVIITATCVAVAAITGGIILAVGAANENAATAEATTNIDASVTAANAALDECLAAVKSSTYSDDADTYRNTVIDVYGEDSEITLRATEWTYGDYTDAYCDDAATITVLADGEDAADSEASIIRANEVAVADYEKAMQYVKTADEGLRDALLEVDGLAGVHATYVAADEAMSATITAGKDLRRGPLGMYLTDEEDEAVNSAVEDAIRAQDGANANLPMAQVAALTDATKQLDDANAVATKVITDATAAAEKDRALTAETSATGGATAAPKAAPKSTEFASSSSTSKPAPKKTEKPKAAPKKVEKPKAAPKKVEKPKPAPEKTEAPKSKGITVSQVKSAIAQYQGGGSGCAASASHSNDSIKGITSWVKSWYDMGPGKVKFDVTDGGMGGANKPLVTVTVLLCG